MGIRRTFLLAAAALVACGTGCTSWTWSWPRSWSWSWPTDRGQAVKHYVRGQVLAEQGDANAALAELTEAVRQDPKLSVAHSAIGDIYRRRGNLQQARDSYETACQTDPYAFRPHYNLALTYQTLSLGAKAVAKAQEYLREAVRVYLRAVAIEPADFDTKLNLAACYFQLGKSDQAEQYAVEAVKLDPNSAHAHSNLGVIYDSQNRSAEAVREYKLSLELDEHQPQLLVNLGVAYMKQQRHKAAIICFEQAVRQDPNFAPAYEQMGSCHFQLRQYDDALAAFEKAAAADPASAPAYRGIGAACMTRYILDHTRTELRDKALDAWDRSLELQPNQKDLLRLIEKYRPKPAAPEL